MLQLNYRDPRPIYEQVKSEFRRLILSGALPRGEKLPSVRELAGSLAINPNTLQRAYRELETEGCIISMPGKGSFVADAADIARQKHQPPSMRCTKPWPICGRLAVRQRSWMRSMRK